LGFDFTVFNVSNQTRDLFASVIEKEDFQNTFYIRDYYEKQTSFIQLMIWFKLIKQKKGIIQFEIDKE